MGGWVWCDCVCVRVCFVGVGGWVWCGWVCMGVCVSVGVVHCMFVGV